MVLDARMAHLHPVLKEQSFPERAWFEVTELLYAVKWWTWSKWRES